MAARKTDYSSEFPLLQAQGLYASKIHGDGNCLFNALSDQLYGHQGKHDELRASAVKEMRQNSSYYKEFLIVHPGGGIRRNEPRRKRKNHGAVPAEATELKAPSPEDIDDAFNKRLENMAQGGTYADNLEIQAFAEAFQKNVKVYRSDTTHTTSPRDQMSDDTVHIAYHNWEHYSSIRNIDGPHNGLPQLKIKELSAEELARQRALAAQPKPITPAMIDEVKTVVPHICRDVIQKALEDLRGDVRATVNKFLDAEDSSSTSSHSGSSATSFTERDADSEDEEPPRGPKRRTRFPQIIASVEKSDPNKQYVPSHLSNSVTAETAEAINTSSEQPVLLPVRGHQTQRIRLRVTKPVVKDEAGIDSDDDFVPETYEDDDENDAASEYSSGTSRSVSSARPSPPRSRSTSKSVATRLQRQARSPSKRAIKPLRSRASQTSVNKVGTFASQSPPMNLGSNSVKGKAIKT